MTASGVVDIPNHRSSHATITPRGGGIACALGLVAAVVSEAVLGPGVVPVAALAAAIVLGAIGLEDDRRGLTPLPRLGAQVAVGLVFGAWVGGVAPALLGAVLFPVVVNVVNFMDGINGITGVTVTLWALCAIGVGLDAGNVKITVLGAAAAGAGLGFLPGNLAGRLFLGDVGSYLLGAVVAAGVLMGVWQSRSLVLLLPMSLYFVDVFSTLVSRLRRGAPIMEAHREHIYQRLANDCGLGHMRVCAIVALLGLMICMAALTAPTGLAVGVAVLASTLYAMSPWLVARRQRVLSA
jgi:UDP-N-acetylmuramyl pentapeptide phosphotransferase/UDP-N-acetylglucosamine-1-phosphate transferase